MTDRSGEVPAPEFWDAAHEVAPEHGIDRTVIEVASGHFGDVRGARLLDLGCGTGHYSRYFAARGADVVAVDTSVVAVDRLRARCEAEGIDNVEAVEADAFTVDRLGSFDLVFGSMILHHLEPFAEFVPVLRRAVVPTGRAVFYENSAQSRVLMWCRTHLAGRGWIPKFGDPAEFPLEPREIDALRTAFRVEIAVPDLVLSRMATLYLLRGRLGRLATRADRALYRVEPLRKYSYRQFVLLS